MSNVTLDQTETNSSEPTPSDHAKIDKYRPSSKDLYSTKSKCRHNIKGVLSYDYHIKRNASRRRSRKEVNPKAPTKFHC